MISTLYKVYSLIGHDVHNSMLKGQSSRPYSGSEISERLRLAGSFEGRSQDFFNKVEDSDRGLSVGLYPIRQVFSEFRLENTFPYP